VEIDVTQVESGEGWTQERRTQLVWDFDLRAVDAQDHAIGFVNDTLVRRTSHGWRLLLKRRQRGALSSRLRRWRPRARELCP
jgi:hypothetical protein